MDMFSSRNWSYRPSSLSAEASASSGNAVSAIQDFYGLDNVTSSGLCTHTETQKAKKRRGVPRNPGNKNTIFLTYFSFYLMTFFVWDFWITR